MTVRPLLLQSIAAASMLFLAYLSELIFHDIRCAALSFLTCFAYLLSVFVVAHLSNPLRGSLLKRTALQLAAAGLGGLVVGFLLMVMIGHRFVVFAVVAVVAILAPVALVQIVFLFAGDQE